MDFPKPDLSNPLVAPFWEWAAKGELRLPRRTDGSGFDWYPSGAEVEWVKLPGTARLYSWSGVTRALHAPYGDIAPYIAAIVVPDGAPDVRLVSRLIDPPADLQMDMALDVRFVDIAYPGTCGTVGPLFAVKAAS